MIEVRVQSLGVDQLTKSPVVILQETGGERVLPIWIGAAEASAIAMELAAKKFTRPLTHDLAASLIRALGGDLQRVAITRVESGTYYAEMVIQHGGELVTVDARPSDSIAIGLRLGAPFFASEGLLNATTLEAGGEASPTAAPDAEVGSALTPEQLQEYLRKLKPEDLGRFNP